MGSKQWGYLPSSTSSGQWIPFPTTFKTMCSSIVLIQVYNGLCDNNAGVYKDFNTQGFHTKLGGYHGYTWHSIGY